MIVLKDKRVHWLNVECSNIFLLILPSDKLICMAKCTSVCAAFDHVIIWTRIRCMHASKKHDRQESMIDICSAKWQVFLVLTWQTLYTFDSERFSQLSDLQWLHCFERSFALWPKIETLNLFPKSEAIRSQEYNLRWLSICCNSPDLIGTDIFSCWEYKLKAQKPISLVRLKIMGDLSEVVKILISLCEMWKGMALVIRSLCSTFHTIYIAMNYLFVVCSGGQRWKRSCGCQKMCESLSLSLSLHFCVCAMRNYGRPNLTLWEV